MLLFSLALLIPLAFAACGGDDEVVIDPNATPSAQLTIRARNLKFDAGYLVAPAGQEFNVTLVNDDPGTIHNFAVYRESNAREVLFRGEVIEGRKTVENRLPALAAGEYYFRCDAHPEMDGTLVVK